MPAGAAPPKEAPEEALPAPAADEVEAAKGDEEPVAAAPEEAEK